VWWECLRRAGVFFRDLKDHLCFLRFRDRGLAGDCNRSEKTQRDIYLRVLSFAYNLQ
jgi:hypothetical protein